MTSNIKLGICNSGNVGTAAIALDLLRTSHLLIQGASGSGKSYTIRVLAEQLVKHLPVIIIDPEGEYHTLREKFPFVLVGEGGETPAAIDTAELLARRLVEAGASSICDLYALEKEDRELWVKTFIGGLMKLPRSTWRPLIVIVDESHLFAPEKGEGSALSTKALEDFCSRGRKHGIGIVLATQRITKLSNNCASEMQNYLIGRTFIQTDRERAAKVLGVPNRNAEKDAFFADLKVLEKGEFWALGVAIHTDRIRVKVNKSETTHPEPGVMGPAHRPPTPDEVRALLPQLEDLPKVAADVADEHEKLLSTVRHQEAEIAELTINKMRLEQELGEKSPIVVLPDFTGIREKLERVQREMETEEFLQHVEGFVRNLERSFRERREVVAEALSALQALEVEHAGAATFTKADELPATGRFFNQPKLRAFGEQFESAARPSPVSDRRTDGARGNVALNSTARRMLEVLVTWHPKGLTKARLAAYVGIKPRGGNWAGRLSELNTAELIRKDGELLFASDAGVRLIGKQRTAAPRTTSEVLAVWNPKLNETARRMLAFLVTHRGRPVPKEAVAEHIGIAARGGNWAGRLSELNTAGLITKHSGGMIAANKDALFL
jgi:uncharacterized protein